MKKIFSLFAAVLFAGAMFAETATYQYIFTSKPTPGKVTFSGVSWTLEATNLNAYNSQYYAGVQIGSSTKTGSFTLTSSEEWGSEEFPAALVGKTKITEVRLWLNTGGSAVTPSVTIGGKAATSDGTEVVKNTAAGNDYSKATKVTFTPAADGNTGIVVINVASAKAGYVCAIEIDSEDSGAAPTKVSKPKFSLAEGEYEGAQNVEIVCPTEGATIYYTLDGTDPTAASTVYSAAIPVAATTTIKAFATKADLENSDIVSATYTIVAGADVTLDFTDNSEWAFPVKPSDNAKTTGTHEYTSGIYTVTVYGPEGNGYYYDTDNLMLGKEGAYVALPVFADKAVAKIVTVGVAAGAKSTTFNIYNGDNAVSTEVTSCQVDQTFEISPKKKNAEYKIVVTNAANLRLSKIKIWFGEADPATAIDNTELEGKAVKAIENGQLVIIKNGVRYNALGNVIR